MQSLSCVRLFMTHGLQHARLPCPSPTPRAYSNLYPLSWMPSPTHLILCRPLLLLPSLFPSIRVFSNGPVLHIRSPSYSVFSTVFDTADQFFFLGGKKILFNLLASVCCSLAFSFYLSVNFFTLPCWLFLLCS